MKRLFLTIAGVALAFPAAAQAKELTGFKLCGPDGCTGSGPISGVGHSGPFDPAGMGQAPPPPGAFYLLKLEVDGHDDAWTVYYEPRTGWVAYTTENGWMTWARMNPKLAGPVKDLAKQVTPFPPPTVSRVRIAGREVSGDLNSYLRLFEIEGPFAVQGDGESDVINLESATPNPWTDAQVLYYPDDDVVQVSAGRTIRLPSGLASDIEAARPLVNGDGLPVFAVAVLAAGALLIAGVVAVLALMLRERRPRASAAKPETA